MRRLLLWAPVALLACTLSAETLEALLPDGEELPGVLVVELFTSEGCSSCPQADALVNAMVQTARAKDLNILCLAYHVDYWDKLRTPHGVWKDPYSNPEATARQNVYANHPSSPRRGMRVTPQLIFNGRNRPQINADSLRQAFQDLERKPAAEVNLSLSLQGNRARIAYEVTGETQDNQLLVAVVERGLVSQVTAGENAGKTLAHHNVVRVYQTVALTEQSKGKLDLELPEGVVADNISALAFVQDANTLEVRGGTRAEPAAADQPLGW